MKKLNYSTIYRLKTPLLSATTAAGHPRQSSSGKKIIINKNNSSGRRGGGGIKRIFNSNYSQHYLHWRGASRCRHGRKRIPGVTLIILKASPVTWIVFKYSIFDSPRYVLKQHSKSDWRVKPPSPQGLLSGSIFTQFYWSTWIRYRQEMHVPYELIGEGGWVVECLEVIFHLIIKSIPWISQGLKFNQNAISTPPRALHPPNLMQLAIV